MPVPESAQLALAPEPSPALSVPEALPAATVHLTVTVQVAPLARVAPQVVPVMANPAPETLTTSVAETAPPVFSSVKMWLGVAPTACVPKA